MARLSINLIMIFIGVECLAQNAQPAIVVKSPDGGKVASIVGPPYLLRVGGTSGKSVQKQLGELAQAVDVMPNPRIAWSPDGRFLALDFEVDEDTHVTQLLDAGSLRVKWSGTSAQSKWLAAGHTLVVVPNTDVEGYQRHRGASLVDGDSGKQRHIAMNCRFSEVISVGRDTITFGAYQENGSEKAAGIVVSAPEFRASCQMSVNRR